MEDFKKGYCSYLDVFKKRQNELGLTNLEMANLLGIRLNNYERLMKGAYPMSVPRFEQVCSVLGFGFCIMDKDMLIDFKRCVEEGLGEDTVAAEDGN